MDVVDMHRNKYKYIGMVNFLFISPGYFVVHIGLQDNVNIEFVVCEVMLKLSTICHFAPRTNQQFVT